MLPCLRGAGCVPMKVELHLHGVHPAACSPQNMHCFRGPASCAVACMPRSRAPSFPRWHGFACTPPTCAYLQNECLLQPCSCPHHACSSLGLCLISAVIAVGHQCPSCVAMPARVGRGPCDLPTLTSYCVSTGQRLPPACLQTFVRAAHQGGQCADCTAEPQAPAAPPPPLPPPTLQTPPLDMTP